MIAATNKFMDYDVFCDELNVVSFSKKIIVNTINQYSFCIAEQDPEFKRALIESDILLPDGIGIVYAIKAASNRLIKKISGADLHKSLLKTLNENKGTCFYLGSSDNTLERIKDHLAADYPDVKPSFFSPPFKADFSDLENEEMIARINRNSPDVLFVGMTAPKQEKWVHQHKHRLNAKVICSIGAVFDFYAGTIKRPQDVWVNLGLEWFIRLCREPKRMWKRYIYYGPVFMFTVLKEVIKSDVAEIYKVNKKIF